MLNRKLLAVLTASLSLAGIATVTACSDSGSGGSGDKTPAYTFCAPVTTCPPDVSGVDLTTPVSFRDDIYNDILIQSCSGGTSCHADDTTSGIAFGTAKTPVSDISGLIAQLKGQKSQVSGIVNVVPGDWESSYMMLKLDGCQNEAGLDCQIPTDLEQLTVCGQSCGDGMPASEGDTYNPTPYPLTDAQRNIIRAWIAQGAEDN